MGGGVATGAVVVTGAGAGIITGGDGAVGGGDACIACHVVGPQTLASAISTKNNRDNSTVGGVERHIMMMKVMVLMLVLDEEKCARETKL